MLLQISDPVSCSGALIGAFELLSKRLRLIDDIPLGVSSVQPLDSGIPFSFSFFAGKTSNFPSSLCQICFI